MLGWGRKENPKEVFPIENFPLETLGSLRNDALSLLYKKTKVTESPAGAGRSTRRLVDLDKEKVEFFRKILPILDGFDSIFRYTQSQNIEQDEILTNWLRTLTTLYRRLISTLEKEGLVKLESIGKPLDLSHHDVIEVREDRNVPDNTILDEVVKGYMYGNRVLRDAKVIVARNPGGVIGLSEVEEEATPLPPLNPTDPEN